MPTFDLDAMRFNLFLLGKVDLQDAILGFSFDLETSTAPGMENVREKTAGVLLTLMTGR